MRFVYDHWLSHHEGRGRIWRLRMFVERGLFGYCREDVWSVDCCLARIVPPMLRELQDGGHPGCFTQDEWDASLERWAVAWEEMSTLHSDTDFHTLHESIDYILAWWC